MQAPEGNRLTIVYCAECAYGRRAYKLAELVLEEFFEFLPGGVLLVPGAGEIFDVYLNDRLLFSKHRSGRHYLEREIEDQLIEILEGVPAPRAG